MNMAVVEATVWANEGFRARRGETFRIVVGFIYCVSSGLKFGMARTARIKY